MSVHVNDLYEVFKIATDDQLIKKADDPVAVLEDIRKAMPPIRMCRQFEALWSTIDGVIQEKIDGYEKTAKKQPTKRAGKVSPKSAEDELLHKVGSDAGGKGAAKAVVKQTAKKPRASKGRT